MLANLRVEYDGEAGACDHSSSEQQQEHSQDWLHHHIEKLTVHGQVSHDLLVPSAHECDE